MLPLYDAWGELIYLLGVQCDVTVQVRAQNKVELKAQLKSLIQA